MTASPGQSDSPEIAEGPERQVRVRIWERRDCIAIAVLCGLWGAALAVLSGGRMPLGTPIEVDHRRVSLVAEKIDPNSDTVASLRRLPLIGPVKARAIVAYRSAARRAATTPAEPVFRYRQDLLKVPGIGPVAILRGGKWLALPERPETTTQP